MNISNRRLEREIKGLVLTELALCCKKCYGTTQCAECGLSAADTIMKAVSKVLRSIRDAERKEEQQEVERRWMWLNHGHGECLYGDDGEMQCVRCTQEGHKYWDWKNAPFEDLSLQYAVIKQKEVSPYNKGRDAERARCVGIARETIREVPFRKACDEYHHNEGRNWASRRIATAIEGKEGV